MIDKMNILNQLNEAYALARSTGEYEKTLEILTGPIKINSLVNYYNNVVQEFDNEDKAIIEMIIRILQEIYNNSDIISPISDEEYDKLYAINLDVNNKDIVGASAGNAKNKPVSAHKYPDLRGTLDKIHFIRNSEKRPGEKRKSLEDWINSVKNKVGVIHDDTIEIFPKWDGISGIFECESDGTVEKVLKRGDTTRNEAEEMTPMFKGINMKDVEFEYHLHGSFGIKTEIIMTHDNYERLCKKYGEFKSPRSAVSSIINSKELDPKYREFLTVIPLQIQDYTTKQIRIPRSTYNDFPFRISKLSDLDGIKQSISNLEKQVKKDLGIDIDGIVIRIINKSLQEKLGRDDNINKYEVAYKLPPEQKTTIINDVEFSVGVLGAVTPVAKIEPVKLKGNTISNISLGSIDRFESLGLCKDDVVLIKYDVIPYLETVPNVTQIGGEPFVTPTRCPYCNEPLVKQPVLRCVNDFCDSRIVGKIMNYVTKMSIPNISIGIITLLFKAGLLSSIDQLYSLENKEKEIIQLEGFGKKLFQKIVDGINSRKEVYDYELVGSIGIPDIGRKMFKKILDIYHIDELMEIAFNDDVNKLTKIGGIKEKTADKIIDGINSNYVLINYLRSVLKVKHDSRKYNIKVAFTKVRDKDFEKYLDSKDVLVMDSYNKNVDMLIVPSLNTSSSKVDKARKDGKEIVAITDAYKMFEYKIE
jgi:NAD-dependent DNA ligase